MQFHALKNSMQGEEVNVDEDVAAGEGVDESNAGQSFVDDAEDQAAKVEFFHAISGIHFGYFIKILIIQFNFDSIS